MSAVPTPDNCVDELERVIREALRQSMPAYLVISELHGNMPVLGTPVVGKPIGSIKRQHSVKAEPMFRESLAMARKSFGEKAPRTLSALLNLGTSLKMQGKSAEAEACYREALEKRRHALGEEHPDTLSLFRMTSRLLRESGKHDESIALLAESEGAARRAFTDPAATRLAQHLLALGRARADAPFDARRYAQAEENLSEAFRIFQAAGDASGMQAAAQVMLGLLGDWQERSPDPARAAAIPDWERRVGAAPQAPRF